MNNEYDSPALFSTIVGVTLVFLFLVLGYTNLRIDALLQEVKTISNNTVTRDFCFSACLKELCEGDECSTDSCACWDICEAGRPKPPHCFTPFYK